MRVTITALKAPWPEGSKVGSVVELEGDTIPAWAAGKCTPVPEGFTPAASIEEVKEQARQAFHELRAEAAERIAAVEAENAALKALLEAGGGGSGPIKPQGEPGAEAVAGGGGSGPIKPSRAR